MKIQNTTKKKIKEKKNSELNELPGNGTGIEKEKLRRPPNHTVLPLLNCIFPYNSFCVRSIRTPRINYLILL